MVGETEVFFGAKLMSQAEQRIAAFRVPYRG